MNKLKNNEQNEKGTKNHKIYAHINKINGKIYIGQTCLDVEDRWREGRGYCGSSKFYHAIEEYGWDNFEHIVLMDNLNIDLANVFEKELIKKYNTTDDQFGYNISYGGGNKYNKISYKNNQLDNIMKNMHITYGQLSKMTGISKSTLFRIANFCQSPTQDMMIIIAKGLNMKVTDVFNLDY